MNRNLSTKTFIVSQIIILIIGLILIAYLFYFLNKEWLQNQNILKNFFYDHVSKFLPPGAQSIFPPQNIDYSPVTKEPSNFNLELTNPEDDILVYEKSLIVSGRTMSMAPIIIYTDDFATAIEANSNGDFSTVVNLSSGLNHISIAAFDQRDGKSKVLEKIVYYSEEKL